MELPAQIGFDIDNEESAKLPPVKASYLSDAGAAETVGEFLRQYFRVFDSDDRRPLHAAYHDESMLSMTCSYHPNPEFR